MDSLVSARKLYYVVATYIMAINRGYRIDVPLYLVATSVLFQ